MDEALIPISQAQSDGARSGSDDPALRLTLLQHELNEARLENVRLRESLLEPPYSQLRSVIRRYPQVSKTAIKALNVVTGTGRINFHRRAMARLQYPRDLREMEGSGLFDAAWYQANYPEVAHSGMEPLRHYALIGAAQGWDPGPRFSTDFYLEHNPDVSRGTNALLHYLRHGAARGSKIAPSTVERQWLTLTLDQRFPNLRPLHVYASTSAPKRISMVTDSINSGSLFGGVGTALIFATLLARRMERPLRIITRSEPPTPANCRTVLEANGIPWKGDVDFVFSSRDTSNGRLVDVADGDLFVTTSWWTTWAVRASVDPAHIIYLVQEDERRFYPEGDDSIRCAEILADPRITRVVNSKPLFDYLFGGPDRPRITPSWFEPAFPAFLTPRDQSPAGKSKFIFYARPNNLRNLYYRGIEAISGAIECGHLDPAAWDVLFIGRDLQPVALPGGVRPTLIQNLDWDDYQQLLRRMDLGFSLMASPHSSYPPLDLAAAGAAVVTNTFGPDKRSLDQYSANIICCDPDLPSLIAGIARGVALANDVDRRSTNHRNSKFQTDWSAVFAPICEQLAGALPTAEG
ncbi:MAG TPA: hypothetical protein VND54_00890 [Candidatus Saccharimonadales bacterium]|nr:hypothetical protein [Candidatus Saccharimonadales bacterium]